MVNIPASLALVAAQPAILVPVETGVGQLVFEAMQATSPDGIVCLTGISSGKRLLEANVTALNRGLVLENNGVFGTVNANRRHYRQAVDALARADHAWREAVYRRPDDVKTVIDLWL